MRSADRLKHQRNVFSTQCHLLSSSLCTSGWPEGCTEMPRGAGDLHLAADTGSELLEASWDAPESELNMDTDTASACSRFPSNPKLKFFFFPFLGGIGIPPSTEGPDGAVTQLKLGGGRRGREYLLRSWLENKIMETSCCFKEGFCC